MRRHNCTSCFLYKRNMNYWMEDQASFFNFLRMPPEMFDELLARSAPRIQKQDTGFSSSHSTMLCSSSSLRGTVKFSLLAPVADHAGNAGLARDTGSVGVYIALLGLGRLRLGGWRLCGLRLLIMLCFQGNT